MHVIYDGRKHRGSWRPSYALAFGAVFAYIAIKPLFSGKEIGVVGTIVSVLFAGVGLWMGVSTVRFYDRVPIDVTILDGGIVQVRDGSGQKISIAAAQFNHISYEYEGSDGTLTLKAQGRAWSFPVSEREAEDIIGALILFNSGIEVERKEVSSGG